MKSPVLSIDLLAWARSFGHNGEEIETVLMSGELVARLGVLATEITNMLGESRYRLEVIKMTPRMGGHLNREISKVAIKAILSEFYFQSKIEAWIEVDAKELMSKDSLPALAQQIKAALSTKVSELSEKFTSGLQDIQRFTKSLS